MNASLFICAAVSGKFRNSACMTPAVSRDTAGAQGITDEVAECHHLKFCGRCALPGLILKFINFIKKCRHVLRVILRIK